MFVTREDKKKLEEKGGKLVINSYKDFPQSFISATYTLPQSSSSLPLPPSTTPSQLATSSLTDILV